MGWSHRDAAGKSGGEASSPHARSHRKLSSAEQRDRGPHTGNDGFQDAGQQMGQECLRWRSNTVKDVQGLCGLNLENCLHLG